MQGLRTCAKEPLRAGHREITLRAKGSWEGSIIVVFIVYVYLITYIQCNIEKNALASKITAKVSACSSDSCTGPSVLSSRQLLGFFIRLLPRRELWKLPGLKNKRFYERLFTPIVTLWYLLFQRLQFDHTLEGVVANAQAGGADSLCKRLSKKLLSTATVSYNNARQRLPLAFLTQALALQARKILGLNPKASWRGLLVSLLDGSTVRMRPFGDIPKPYPCSRTSFLN